MKAEDVQKALKALGSPEVEAVSRRFFKTGPGQYGEGDLFRGIKVPSVRAVAVEFRDLPFSETKRLLTSTFHEDRMAIVATLRYIRKDDFEDTFRIADQLIDSEEDLLHKAAGWMLREVGKRDRKAEERFLARHCRTMPRTMLRYAIEHFPEARRRAYLKGAI